MITVFQLISKLFLLLFPIVLTMQLMGSYKVVSWSINAPYDSAAVIYDNHIIPIVQRGTLWVGANEVVCVKMWKDTYESNTCR